MLNIASAKVRYPSPARRYLAVCHPFFVHQGQGPPGAGGGGGSGAVRAFKRRTWRYLMPALTLAVAINVPKFLEFRNVSQICLHSIYTVRDSICSNGLTICLQPCLVRQRGGRQPDQDHAHRAAHGPRLRGKIFIIV